MSENNMQPFGGRDERPDDELPGERPVSEEEKHVEAPDKDREHDTASRAADEGEMASDGGAVSPDPGVPHRVEPPSPADATEGDPPGGSAANQTGRTPDRSPSEPSDQSARRS